MYAQGPKYIPAPPVNTAMDENYLRFVGWNPVQGGYNLFFSKENIQYLHNRIHESLQARGHNIRLTDTVLGGVMSAVFQSNDPVIGDAYTQFTIPAAHPRNDLKQWNQRVIDIVVNYILDEYENTKANQRLTKWTTVLGDFNPDGLRSHDILKTKKNDYRKGFTLWNY